MRLRSRTNAQRERSGDEPASSCHRRQTQITSPGRHQLDHTLGHALDRFARVREREILTVAP